MVLPATAEAYLENQGIQSVQKHFRKQSVENIT
jgi:hypothetical protein